MGFFWNEAEANAEYNRGLLTIMAFDRTNRPHIVGTGFIVGVEQFRAVCVTAAHVFAEVRRLQSPPQRHSLSALPEFLPPPKSIELDSQRVRAISMEGGRPEVLCIDGLVFDEATDIAFFSVVLQCPPGKPYFTGQFVVDGTPPAVGDYVAVLSYGDQASSSSNRTVDGGQEISVILKRRPVLRVGRVLAHYPDGHRLCRGPCIETSIPVYSGMSGGPAMHYGMTGSTMTPFGLVCSDPDWDGESKQDRSIEGHSILAILPCQTSFGANDTRISTLTLPPSESSGSFFPWAPRRDFL